MADSRMKKTFQNIVGRNKEKAVKSEAADFEEQETSIVEHSENKLDESQMAEQLYTSAGLEPVVSAGLEDYDKHIRAENKFINRLMGPSSGDIRGYGDAVARRVALAVYTLLNKQYGGKVGDMRSYIMALEDERDRANLRYDELMGRVVGILGDEYRSLRTDSKDFMEKLTTVLGDDLKGARLDQQALAEKLADIDGLRARVIGLEQEKEQLKEKHETKLESLKNEHKGEISGLKAGYESQIGQLKSEHASEVAGLKGEISALESEKEVLKQTSDVTVAGLEKDKQSLSGDLASLREEHDRLKAAIKDLVDHLPDEGIGKQLGKEQYEFLLSDSKVPEVVIGGVGRFIDFKKYLGLSVDRGIQEAGKRITEVVETISPS